MVNEKLDKINRTNQMPIPALAEATEYVDAGPLTIGVEFRFLTGELVVQDYIRQGLDPAKAPKPENVPPERGISLHVYAREEGDLVEHLRFDCFDEDPHYHYITPPEKRQVVCPFDRVANGDTLQWSLDTLKSRAAPMFRQAGALELAGVVEQRQDEINAAIPRVAAAAERALANAPEDFAMSPASRAEVAGA